VELKDEGVEKCYWSCD